MGESIKTHGNGSTINDRLNPVNETGTPPSALQTQTEQGNGELCIFDRLDELIGQCPTQLCPYTVAEVFQELDHSFNNGIESAISELLTWYGKVYPADPAIFRIAEIAATIHESAEMRAYKERKAKIQAEIDRAVCQGA